MISITPVLGLPHAVLGEFISVSGGWRLLWKELIIAEDSPHITMLHGSTFECSLGVVAGVNVL